MIRYWWPIMYCHHIYSPSYNIKKSIHIFYNVTYKCTSVICIFSEKNRSHFVFRARSKILWHGPGERQMVSPRAWIGGRNKCVTARGLAESDLKFGRLIRRTGTSDASRAEQEYFRSGLTNFPCVRLMHASHVLMYPC